MRIKASSYPYDAGATGRRAQGWNVSRLGPTTLLWGNLDQIRARSRDQIRNNPWATAAIDRFESNVIGTGIVPHWQHRNESIRLAIQQAWSRWCKKADWSGQSDFYGLQALMAREVFEAGEVFARHRLRADGSEFIPYKIQLMEGEQLPVYRNVMPGNLESPKMIRTGIEFNDDGRRVAYWFYKEHPGETMFYPLDALAYVNIPADEIQHVYKPLRVGQLRGQPHLTTVLALLFEIEQYSDAELVRKKVAAMFAGFITKPSPEVQILPPDPNYPSSPNQEDPLNPTYTPAQDIGTDGAKLEPGTLQTLFPGEEITFPQVPQSGDFQSFLNIQLHKLAAGLGGLTYEQITTDLRGVNYSSIRAGLLEMRRSIEQFQYNVIIHQALEPIKDRWLKEAVLSGALKLPGYLNDPAQYEEVVWVTPGWQWVDPAKEMAAYQMGVRSGFTSRTMVVREAGYDPELIDTQQAQERKRAAELGITYDSDPNKVLIGRETQPELPQNANPPAGAAEEEESDTPTA